MEGYQLWIVLQLILGNYLSRELRHFQRLKTVLEGSASAPTKSFKTMYRPIWTHQQPSMKKVEEYSVTGMTNVSMFRGTMSTNNFDCSWLLVIEVFHFLHLLISTTNSAFENPLRLSLIKYAAVCCIVTIFFILQAWQLGFTTWWRPQIDAEFCLEIQFSNNFIYSCCWIFWNEAVFCSTTLFDGILCKIKKIYKAQL